MTPNELHAIKESVAAVIVRAREMTLGELGTKILDAIDHGADTAALRRVIVFDADTGDELLPSEAATGPIRERMAAQLLPGMPVELVAKAYEDWLNADPVPFAVGKPVTRRNSTSRRGKVIRRVETDGELHTVVVKWDSQIGEYHYSPRELEELRP